MSTFEINDLLEKFTLSTLNHFNASLAGDWKTANREVAKIRKITKNIRDFGDVGRDALLSLTNNPNSAVSAMAAMYSIKYAPEKSLSVLVKISQEPGLIGFEAGQAIQRWNEGNWMLEE